MLRSPASLLVKRRCTAHYHHRRRSRHCMVCVNETIEIRSLVSRGPKTFKLAMASRRAALSGNTSLIATFSNYLCRP